MESLPVIHNSMEESTTMELCAWYNLKSSCMALACMVACSKPLTGIWLNQHLLNYFSNTQLPLPKWLVPSTSTDKLIPCLYSPTLQTIPSSLKTGLPADWVTIVWVIQMLHSYCQSLRCDKKRKVWSIAWVTVTSNSCKAPCYNILSLLPWLDVHVVNVQG